LKLLLKKRLLLTQLMLAQQMLALLENNIPSHEQGTVLFDRPDSQSSWTSW
jgi:hypothetical protein